jgi:hypothetical protein
MRSWHSCLLYYVKNNDCFKILVWKWKMTKVWARKMAQSIVEVQ